MPLRPLLAWFASQGVPTKDAEGQALALGFTRAKNLGDNVSRRRFKALKQEAVVFLYAVVLCRVGYCTVTDCCVCTGDFCS